VRNFNIKKGVVEGQTQSPAKRRKDALQPFFAKVLAINLTNTTYPIGTIKFEVTDKVGETATIASPFSYGLKQYPLVGEFVLIHPSAEDSSDLLYSLPANVQNSPTTNIVDGAYSKFFIEREDINPLQPFNGDTLLEGRHGQSIRFSHIQDPDHSWGGKGGVGSAITFISNGQSQTEDGRDYILEDVNNTSILVLTEDASLPLEDSSKRDSYEEAPLSADLYKGSQVILSSNRLYLRAAEESILLSAQNNNIGLSANTVNIDGSTSIRLDTPSYYLNADTFSIINQERKIDSETTTYNFTQFDLNGTNVNINHNRIGLGENAAEPLLQSTEFLTDIAALNTSLTQLATALSGVVGLLAALPGGQVPATILQTAATTLTTQANSIQSKAVSGTYLSTTVFSK
jgi:hypothetical protein